MSDEICPFCGEHPFEYVDVGVGGLGVPVAVTCCDLGDFYFRGQRPTPETVEIAYEAFEKIGITFLAMRNAGFNVDIST